MSVSLIWINKRTNWKRKPTQVSCSKGLGAELEVVPVSLLLSFWFKIKAIRRRLFKIRITEKELSIWFTLLIKKQKGKMINWSIVTRKENWQFASFFWNRIDNLPILVFSNWQIIIFPPCESFQFKNFSWKVIFSCIRYWLELVKKQILNLIQIK